MMVRQRCGSAALAITGVKIGFNIHATSGGGPPQGLPLTNGLQDAQSQIDETLKELSGLPQPTQSRRLVLMAHAADAIQKLDVLSQGKAIKAVGSVLGDPNWYQR